MKKLNATKWAAVLATASLATMPAVANNILGIDVSNYQGSINWTSVHNAGVVFAFAKATEGNYFEDGDYNANMTNGKNAGVYMGAYHFARPGQTYPSTQANYFWAFAGGKIVKDQKTLDPMIDFEEFSGSDGASNYTAWFNAWSSDVKAKTSNFMHPVIYCSAGSGACDLIEYDKSGGIYLSGWIAHYNGDNLYTGNPWDGCCSCCNAWVTGCGKGNWTYWQVSSTGSIPGISGGVDLDAYPLTKADLIAYQGVGN